MTPVPLGATQVIEKTQSPSRRLRRIVSHTFSVRRATMNRRPW
jgi:hypothetical protein